MSYLNKFFVDILFKSKELEILDINLLEDLFTLYFDSKIPDVEKLKILKDIEKELSITDPFLIRAEYNSKEKLTFKEDIDNEFFDILVSLYKPFLSSSYKNADIKYTVFSSKYKYPIGIVALNKTKSGGNFFEIALIPEVKGEGYGVPIVKKFARKHKLKKIGWTADKSNLPSIKLLKKLGGGFFENTVKNKKRKEAEGFLRVEKEDRKKIKNTKMKESIENLIPESMEKYKKWLNIYKERKKELEKLNVYLNNYKGER